MSFLIRFLLFLTFLLSLLVSCTKKSQHDPSVSLRSPKARLTNTWKLVNQEIIDKINDTIILYTFSGSTLIAKTGGSILYEHDFSDKRVINGDGTYKREIREGGKNYSYEGYWFFNGKNKALNIKDKETVLFTLNSSVEDTARYSFLGIEYDATYVIDKLTKNKLVLKRDFSYSDSDSNYFARESTLYYESEKD